jgi:zinc protease
MRFIYAIVLALFLAATAGASEPALDISKLRFPVIKKVLPNGLTVLMHVDHSVPTISYHTWFRVGSKYEEPGFTGIAHLFEHMMFKGAKRYSASEFESVMQANGITNNAFTTYDYTGYYEDLPSGKLKLVIDIESDRMESLQLTQEHLTSEREVVKEERRWRVDNSISGVLNEALWSKAFKVHPYHWPVIGIMTDIDNLTLDRCKQFFHTYYSPTNAVIAIAGDFDPDQAVTWLNKYYGHLPRVDVPAPKVTPEPPQDGPREANIEKVAQTEHSVVAYHIGKQGDEDSYVMDLIANILTEGESSRLYRRFVYHDQSMLAVDGASITPQDPGLFEIFMEFKPGFSHVKILPQVYAELARLTHEKVSEAELEKSKNQIMKHWVDSMKKIHDKGYSLVLNEVVTGSYENLFDDLLKYQKITRDDIQRVAAKYFKDSNRTVVNLIPKSPLAKAALSKKEIIR